jgi:2-dehydro-3-deoxyphosphogluconate aldolase / (4S)-4-hydroxy-2-oxoglutarate aldolase
MQAQKVREAIIGQKLIAIIRGVEGGKIIETVDALSRGGIHLVEITLDQSDEGRLQEALDAIRCVSREFNGRVFAGAGTVLTPAQASRAVEAGALYIISPDTNPAVIRRTRELGALAIPGAFTPTEIAGAAAAGADFVKLFPAGLLGCEYVKTVRAPLPHIRLLAVGGVDLTNAGDFLRAGVVGFGIGSNLVDRKLVSRGSFGEIEARSRAFVHAVTGDGAA